MKNKTVLVSIFIAFLIFGSFKNESEKTDYPIQKWSFNGLNEIILGVFPEAYKDFLEISFERVEENIYPVIASFLIPSKYFKTKITQDILNQRAQKVLLKIGNPGACQQIEAGNPEEYGWYKWEDKNVKKVTLKFYIGC